ncbi:MAG: ferredoxin family protein [Actinobacteria bacterium]|jgi:adenylylsulfate reductase subunit B|nr:ferredoxin family protein [Actinomycetota bacterium]
MPPEINDERCDGCGICVNVCPEDVFYGSAKRCIPTVTYPDECWHCNACVIECTRQAIHLYIPLPMRL